MPFRIGLCYGPDSVITWFEMKQYYCCCAVENRVLRTPTVSRYFAIRKHACPWHPTFVLHKPDMSLYRAGLLGHRTKSHPSRLRPNLAANSPSTMIISRPVSSKAGRELRAPMSLHCSAQDRPQVAQFKQSTKAVKTAIFTRSMHSPA